ncbi:MAG TPA: hypothetical protein VNL77_08935 [Roseiflexaceae bacterium]|nr:hypothetical protein [Roseiflexaceae bacterium]
MPRKTKSKTAPAGFTGRTAPASPSPLSAEEFKSALVSHATSRPQVLSEQEYRDLLDRSVVAGFQHGSALLNEVRTTLQRLADSRTQPATLAGDAPQADELHQAMQKIDQAIGRFQYAALWHVGAEATPDAAPWHQATSAAPDAAPWHQGGPDEGLRQASPVIVHAAPSRARKKK